MGHLQFHPAKLIANRTVYSRLLSDLPQHALLRISLATNLILFSFMLVFFNIGFKRDDTAVIMLLANGSLGGSPDEHLVYIHYLFGLILKPLYTLAPSISWFTWACLTLLFFSFTTLLWSFLQLCAKRVIVFIYLAFFAFYGLANFLILLDFTQISFAIGAAGLSLVLVYVLSERSRLSLVVFALIFLALTSVFREKSLYLIIVFFVCIVPFSKKKMPVMLVLLALSLLIHTGLVSTNDKHYHKDTSWSQFKNFDDHMSWAIDYAGEADPLVFQKTSITPVQLEAFRHWLLFDEKTITHEFISNLTPYLPTNNFSPITLLDRALSKFFQIWQKNLGNFWSLLSLIGLAYLIFARHQGKTRLVLLVALLVTCSMIPAIHIAVPFVFLIMFAGRIGIITVLAVLHIAILSYFSLLNRLPSHVTIGISFILISLAATIISSRLPYSPWLADLIKKSTTILFLLITGSIAFTLVSTSPANKARISHLSGLLSEIAQTNKNPDQGKIYITFPGINCLQSIDPFPASTMPAHYWKNIALMGWLTRSPVTKNTLMQHGITNISTAIASDRRIRLFTDWPRRFSSLRRLWLEQHKGLALFIEESPFVFRIEVLDASQLSTTLLRTFSSIRTALDAMTGTLVRLISTDRLPELFKLIERILAPIH